MSDRERRPAGARAGRRQGRRPAPPDLGAQIRRRRRRAGLTLEALAAASGVSATMLSEVERSRKNPTVRLAWQIARALGCSLTDLLEESPPPPPRVVRAHERAILREPDGGVERFGVRTALAGGALEVAEYRLRPGAGTGPMEANRDGVLEHVVVVSGRLLLRVGDATMQLRAGDHATYAPQVAVEYRAGAGRACRFLLLSDAGERGRR